mmetsp:Transcript_15210/g.37531  ORF Transcript_15210/g.37531 Transcript_15210/m.37531 type:complete len:752 (-) Transcript_15210:4563-6818(-)
MNTKMMTVLRDDDIWIDRLDHPGTRLLVDVVRECVIEFHNAEYCKEIYRRIKKDLMTTISHGSNSSSPPRIYTGPNERNLTVCEGPVLARTIGHLYDNECRSCSAPNKKRLPRRSNENKFDYVERLNESGLISARSIRSSRSCGSGGSHRSRSKSRSHRSKSRSRRGSRSRSHHSRSRSRSRHGDGDGHRGRSGRSRSRHGSRSRSRSRSGRSRSRSRSRSSHGSDRSPASKRSSNQERKSNRRRYGRCISSRSLDSRTSRRSSRRQGVEYDSKDRCTDDKDRRRQYKRQGSQNNSTQSLQSLESSRSSKQQCYERGGSLRSLRSQRSQRTEQSESRQQLRDRSDRDRRSLRKVDRDDHSFESMNGKSDSTNSGSSKIRKRRKKKRPSVDASSLVYNKIDAQSHYDGTSLSMDKSSRTNNTAISSRSPIQPAALDVGDIESGIHVVLYPDLNPDDLDVNFVYLDVEECPGTITLYDTMQKVGDKNGWPKYSRKICKSIIKKMGTEMRYFESLSSGNEITDANTLYSSFRPLYLKHQYMKKANIRDVYFDVPNHPGNSAFLRAVQQETIKGGVDQKFDWSVYIKIKKRLYDSEYFVGTPPSCFQIVADQDLYGRVKERYLHEVKRRKRILKWRSAKPVPGTVFCPTLMRRLLACLNRILCSRMSQYCCKDSSRCQQNYLRLSSCWVRTTKCWRYDPVTKKTIWERINDDFTIKYREGCTTSWPLLILSGAMLFVVVALFVQLITKSILFKFI